MWRDALGFLPTQCEVCRTWNGEALCAACRSRFATPAARCRRCGLRIGVAGATCGACLVEPGAVERTVVAFDYAFPWDRLILAFKFGGRIELAPALAKPLAEAARQPDAAGEAPAATVDCLAAVPLARSRLGERGFNQSWELARRIGRLLELPAHADLLLRALDTPHQAALGRAERARNLRAAFAPGPRARERLAGRRVALVDDVMTTGATAREAAAALMRAGAAGVDLWVLARTPEPAPGSRAH